MLRSKLEFLLNDLAEDCLTRGMLYPPDPGEKFACVGGNVATNAGGMRAVKYGATRDYVRAMTVVLPTGEITHFRCNCIKNIFRIFTAKSHDRIRRNIGDYYRIDIKNHSGSKGSCFSDHSI